MLQSEYNVQQQLEYENIDIFIAASLHWREQGSHTEDK